MLLSDFCQTRWVSPMVDPISLESAGDDGLMDGELGPR